MHPKIMQCHLENIIVNYETYGQGRPLLLIPGWSMPAHTHASLMEPYLQERPGWQRIYVDPPGHGRTPGANWISDLDQMLDLLTAFVDRVLTGKHFALHGTSLGAYLARGILYRRRDLIDGLSMLVPVITPTDSKRDRPSLTVLVEEAGVMDSLSAEEREWMGLIVVRSRSYLEQMRAWPELAEEEQGDYEYLQAIRENPGAYCCSFDVDALDEPFSKPALIITGRQDSSVGFKDAWRLLENYPRATYVVFDRAGHFMEEKESLIGPLFNEWLDRVEEATPTA
ncbi:MAG: alpha/beta fold hydrolase [Candidatus Promineifilaceae bacterium]|jgi:pimeloyl-ACP methyl ester carboxylesterase